MDLSYPRNTGVLTAFHPRQHCEKAPRRERRVHRSYVLSVLPGTGEPLLGLELMSPGLGAPGWHPVSGPIWSCLCSFFMKRGHNQSRVSVLSHSKRQKKINLFNKEKRTPLLVLQNFSLSVLSFLQTLLHDPEATTFQHSKQTCVLSLITIIFVY